MPPRKGPAPDGPPDVTPDVPPEMPPEHPTAESLDLTHEAALGGPPSDPMDYDDDTLADLDINEAGGDHGPDALSDSQASGMHTEASHADAGGRKQAKVILCPYCGHTQSGSVVKGNRCVQCGGLFEPLSRRATQIAMGPWSIRDKSNPFRPGFSYEVLKKMIASGRVKPTTVLRGPTTRQFWSIARNVPGVAHLTGFCHKCGKAVEPDLKKCPHCTAPFKSVKTRNELGLLFPDRKAAEAAQRSLNRLLGIAPATEDATLKPSGASAAPRDEAQGSAVAVSPSDSAAHPSVQGEKTSAFDADDAMSDLLDDVLGPGAVQGAVPGVSPGGAQGLASGQKVEALDFAPSGSDDEDDSRAAPAPPPPVRKPKRHKTESPARHAAAASPHEQPRPLSPPNPAALPPRTGLSPLVWGLIVMNVLVAAAVVAWVVLSPSPGP